MTVAFVWIAVIVIGITSIGLLLARDWRWSIILLAVQYLGMFELTLQHWPLGMASVKVVAGWMSAAILGMTRSGLSNEDADEIGMGLLHLGITSRVLRVTIGLMTILSGFEILYSAVEGSVLVAALLAIINLGLALVGSYLLIASNTQEAKSI